MESLNFDKLLDLKKLVTDIFHSCDFSGPEFIESGLIYTGHHSVTPGQPRVALCHVRCFDDQELFRTELKSRLGTWYFEPLLNRRVQSYILATSEVATEEDQVELLKRNEAIGIQGYTWDRIELTRLLLNVVPDSQFVISRNFSDYGGEVLSDRIERADDKATTLKDLAPNKAATIFADLFKDCKEPLEAWLVFDMLHQPYREMTHSTTCNLYNYVAALEKFQCKPLHQSMIRTLTEVLSFSHHDDIKQSIVDHTRFTCEACEMDDYKIDTVRLVRNTDSFHLVFDVTANLRCSSDSSEEFAIVTAVITEDEVEIQE